MNRKSLVVGLGLGLSLLAVSPARADLLPPNHPVAGLSQAEWSVRWWQWAVSFPVGNNPVQDTTGTLSFLGDQGPVFFLAGAFTTAPVTRSVTVGSNQFLFFPVLNAVILATDPSDTEASLRQRIGAPLNRASGLFATLNGAPLSLPPPTTSLLDFRQLSPPGLFDVTLPENNVYFNLPPGSYQAVSDGYWLMLEPLAPGSYQLHFGGQMPGFSQDIIYNITVAQAVPEPSGLALLGLGSLALLGYGWQSKRSRSSAEAA